MWGKGLTKSVYLCINPMEIYISIFLYLFFIQIHQAFQLHPNAHGFMVKRQCSDSNVDTKLPHIGP